MRKRRILSLLLTLCLLLSLVPSVALAADVRQFDDVSAGAWYYEDVAFVARNGYFKGVSETKFAPDGTMTRAMLATVLARYAGATVDNSRSTFSDVPVNTWYTGSVTWANENGIVNGYGGGTFGPDNPITRQELAAMICRFIDWYEGAKNAEHYTGAPDRTFKDEGAIADWAKAEVAECVDYGLFQGDDHGNFAPAASSTRAQIAAVIHRLNWVKGGPIDQKDYKITLYSEGKVYDSATVKGGDTYTMPKNPTRSGYSFKGWSLTEDGAVDSTYKAGAEIIVSGDLTLYAVWQSTGGGGGGGGGGNVTPPTPAAYTLTIDPNDGSAAVQRTVNAGDDGTYKYTLLETDKPAARENYYFAGWADTQDALTAQYAVGAQVDVPQTGKTIYAVWIKDYVGEAVENTWSWAQTDVQDKLNSALGKLSEFINTQLDTDPQVGTDFADELNIEINYPEKASMEQGGRKVEVTITAKTNTPSVLAVSEFVIRYASGMLGDAPTHSTADVKAMVKEMIREVVADLGYDLDESAGMNAALDKLVDELADDYGNGFKDNWKIVGGEKGQGAPAIKGMKATCNGQEITNVTVGSITWDTVKDAAGKAALEVAKGLRDSASDVTTWSGDLKLSAQVDVEFTPAESIKAAYKTGAEGETDKFPTEYTIDFKVNFESDYLQYKHDNGEHYIKVILPEKVNTAYNNEVGSKLEGLLTDPKVTGKLDDVINDAKTQLTNTLNEKIGDIGDDFGLGDLSTTLGQNIGVWLNKNKLTGTTFTESYIYKRLSGDASAQPESREGLSNIVTTAATGVQTMINDKLSNVPTNEYKYTYSGQELTVNLGINANQTIKDAIKSATPGDMGTALNNAITSRENQIDGLTADTLQDAWDKAVDACDGIEGGQKGAAKQALTTELSKLQTEAKGKLSEIKSLVTQLQELEQEDNETIQKVIKYLEAYIIYYVGPNYEVDTTTPMDDMYNAIADYVYEQVSGYSDLVQLYVQLQTFDGVWEVGLNDLTSLLDKEEVKGILTDVITADNWNTAAEYVGKVANTLVDGKIGTTDIPLFKGMKNVNVTLNDGQAINFANLSADLMTLQTKLAAVGTEKAKQEDANVGTAYDAVVTQLTTILNKYGISELGLSSFDEDNGGVKITATYKDITISFHLVLEKDWVD